MESPPRRKRAQTKSPRKGRKTSSVVYYALNPKADTSGIDYRSDTGQLAILLEGGGEEGDWMSMEQLADALKASLEWMTEMHKEQDAKKKKEEVDKEDAAHCIESMREGYEQHNRMLETLPELLKELCEEKLLVRKTRAKL